MNRTQKEREIETNNRFERSLYESAVPALTLLSAFFPPEKPWSPCGGERTPTRYKIMSTLPPKRLITLRKTLFSNALNDVSPKEDSTEQPA